MREGEYSVGKNRQLAPSGTCDWMSELEITPVKYPYRELLNPLRVVGDFITICFVLEQYEFEYPKRIMTKDT